MSSDRVIHYTKNDFAYGLRMRRIEKLVNIDVSKCTINDYIEFFEIKKHFDDGFYFTDWSNADKEKYIGKSSELFSLTMSFFNSLNDSNVVSEYSKVERNYNSIFWELFDKCKLYNNISGTEFAKLIKHENSNPFCFLKFKRLSDKYSNEIVEYLENSKSVLSVIVYVYEQNYNDHEKIYLPKSFYGNTLKKCVENSIDKSTTSPKDLEALLMFQYNDKFPISEEIKLLAKRKVKVANEQALKNGITWSQGIRITIEPTDSFMAKCETNGNEQVFRYSRNHLIETLDYPSILNNFIYLFEYTDSQMRCQHYYIDSYAGVFERAFQSQAKNDYPTSTAFDLLNDIANYQMQIYYDFLKQEKIYLEDVFTWFFTEYLQKEFNCPDFSVLFPSKDSTYYEKCCAIASSFDNVIKQFSIFVKNGDIDFELLEMSTTPISFSNIPSQVKDKYLYGNGKDFNNITYLLFSDQSMLHYVERLYNQKIHYASFFELLKKEKVFLSDYPSYEHGNLNYLDEKKIITIDKKTGEIRLPYNIDRIVILHDLYHKKVISKHFYYSKSQACIDEMIKDGLIIEKSSLLSEPESNYFNYILNRKEYRNGLEIRNKYIHGNQQLIKDEDVHKYNYCILLRMFMILIIKINDDFCLNNQIDKLKNDKNGSD